MRATHRRRLAARVDVGPPQRLGPRNLGRILVVSIATATCLVGSAQAETPAGQVKLEIKDWTLDNGMRVIFAAHRRVPAVTVQVWYHTGSKDERPGIRGVAHMFEHMMFKGSKHVRPEKHAQLISAIGGSTNAFTSQDVTAYHNTLPKQYIEFAMQLEAERMQHLMLTQKTIDSEREVVKEEKRKRLENSPIGRALEAIHAMAYIKHPYAWTPAGDIPDLDRVTIEDCQRFFDTYYVPNNATLIVVGDTDETDVRRLAQSYFGGIARGADPPRVTTVEPPQLEIRERVADWPSQLGVVLGAYHIPEARHADLPALQVLSTILSAGRSSRMHQALVRKGKKALQAGGFIWPHEHPGLMLVYGVGLPTHDLRAMETAVLAQVERLASGGVSGRELKKAINQLSVGHIDGLKTLWGVAYRIGNSLFLEGDPRAFLSELDRLEKVTAADVKRVAATYLKRGNLTLVRLPAGQNKPAKAGVSQNPASPKPTVVDSAKRTEAGK